MNQVRSGVRYEPVLSEAKVYALLVKSLLPYLYCYGVSRN